MAKCGPFTLCGINSFHSLGLKKSPQVFLPCSYMPVRSWLGLVLYVEFVRGCTKRRADYFELLSTHLAAYSVDVLSTLLSF